VRDLATLAGRETVYPGMYSRKDTTRVVWPPYPTLHIYQDIPTREALFATLSRVNKEGWEALFASLPGLTGRQGGSLRLVIRVNREKGGLFAPHYSLSS